MRPPHPPARGPVGGSPAAPADARRRLGARGERLAAEHLGRLGFRLLARNVRTRHGEIDLIAFDGHTLVFAEVKTRRVRRPAAAARCDPLSSLRPRQRVRLRRLAVAWLSSQRAGEGDAPPFAQAIRFDAIGVVLDGGDALLRLDHLEGAW
ncbi:MAG TPA: YraN family protein [Solirubrobacteraceae bacterium]